MFRHIPRRALGILSVSCLAALSQPARAETPRLVADIAPVHGLIAAVMDGVGSPDLLLPQGGSPHDHAMRPSEARALQDADLVVWIGPDLTPWLSRALESLAGDTRQLVLLDAPETRRLDWSKAEAETEAEEHAQGDDAHHDHAGDDHAHDGHDHAAEHDHAHDHAHTHAAEHDHDHGPIDPHAWLYPDNAVAWLGLIAEALAQADPAQAETYRANAARAAAEIETAAAEVAAALAPLRGLPYVVQHDAYRYFEAAFGLAPLAAIADSDASASGPARIAALRREAGEMGALCVFAEPQFAAALAERVARDTGARLATLDPLGADLAPGPDFYPALLRAMATQIEGCLAAR